MDKIHPETVFTLDGTLEAFSTPDLHAHECHQLLRIRSGTTLLVTGDWQLPLFSNMTALIPAGLYHRSVVIGDPVRYKSVYLGQKDWQSGSDTIRIFDMSRLGVALFDRVCLGRENKETGRKGDREFHLQCLDLLLTLVNQELYRTSRITRIPVASHPDNEKLTEYIKDHFKEKLQLPDFARVVNYSPRHVCRRFKADLGLTLFGYLRLYRMFQAAVLLSDSRLPVTQVAFSVGYDTLSSFYKDFKAVFAVTPKAFAVHRSGGKSRF